MSKSEWKHLDITSDELNRLTNAFKSEKFRELFVEYCQELSDPENRRVYEQELRQLEAERGIDVTFINPAAGFVIKASADGQQKVFINVAKCANVGRPTSECGVSKQTGEKGLNWQLPFVQSKPKHDFDRNRVICAVFDVIFHPDALHLAAKNGAFKKLLVDTACDAVCDAYDIKLDRCNLRFPKMAYKGLATPAVIRTKHDADTAKGVPHPLHRVDSTESEDDKSSAGSTTCDESHGRDDHYDYATPKYELIHRRHVEMHEYTYEMDAKLNLTLPKELVVKVRLPMLSSAKHVVLDVNTKSLHLHCDHGSKYWLDIKLPYEVDKQIGTAKFDAQQKVLTIALPVLRRKELGMLDLCRDDSGVESDHHSPKDDEDDVFEDACDSLAVSKRTNKTLKDNESVGADAEQSLDASKEFVLPHFTYNRFENIVAFTLHVKNVEPESLVVTNTDTSYQCTFSTLGSGFVPAYYAFYFEIPADSQARIMYTPQTEAWENNVVVQLTLSAADTFRSYRCGRQRADCTDFVCGDKKLHGTRKAVEAESCASNQLQIETAITKKELQIEIKNRHFVPEPEDGEFQQQQHHEHQQRQAAARAAKASKKAKKAEKPKMRSYSESHCDVIADVLQAAAQPLAIQRADNHSNSTINSTKGAPITAVKHRTLSESSSDDHHTDSLPLKSILKHHSSYDRTASESSLADERYSVSTDLGIGSFKSIPEEKDLQLSDSVKKTVRFDKHLCRKFLFRMNSTILGQRKPKENKRKKKKQQNRRCNSEGDASDYESPMCGTHQHQHQHQQQQQHKPQPEIKNNLIFDIEI